MLASDLIDELRKMIDAHGDTVVNFGGVNVRANELDMFEFRSANVRAYDASNQDASITGAQAVEFFIHGVSKSIHTVP